LPPFSVGTFPGTTDAPSALLPSLDRFGLLGEVAAAIADRYQVSAEFAFAAVLGAVAVPCGLGLSVQVQDDWREPAVLPLLLVADPGERKTPTLAALLAGLEQAEAELAEQREAERRAARVQQVLLDEEVRAAASPQAKAEAIVRRDAHAIPPPFVAITEGGTAEALEVLAAEQGGRVAIVTDEGGNLYLNLTQYSPAANVAVLIAGYEGRPYSNHRVGRASVRLASVRIPLFAMAQPVVLEALCRDRVVVGRGLLARFAVVVPETMVGRRRGFAAPMDPALAARFADLTRSLMLAAYSGEAVATLAPDALARLEEFHDAVEARMGSEFSHPAVRLWAAKQIGRTARIAAILRAGFTGQLGGTVTEETMGLAVEAAEWLAAHAVEALGGAVKLSPDAQRLAGWAAKHRPGEPFRPSEAVKGLHRWDRRRLDEALEALEALGLAERVSSRPERWVVVAADLSASAVRQKVPTLQGPKSPAHSPFADAADAADGGRSPVEAGVVALPEPASEGLRGRPTLGAVLRRRAAAPPPPPLPRAPVPRRTDRTQVQGVAERVRRLQEQAERAGQWEAEALDLADEVFPGLPYRLTPELLAAPEVQGALAAGYALEELARGWAEAHPAQVDPDRPKLHYSPALFADTFRRFCAELAERATGGDELELAWEEL
jgi:hypothetical protein